MILAGILDLDDIHLAFHHGSNFDSRQQLSTMTSGKPKEPSSLN